MAYGLLNACGMIQHVPHSKGKATEADLAALYGEDSRYELIHGELIEKAMPRPLHQQVIDRLLVVLGRRFDRKPGGKWPGGWWIRSELHVRYETQETFCHDLCGYRRDSHAEIPEAWPVKLRPDWVCEALSPHHEKRDLHDKWRVLQAAGVPYYWIVDPEEKLMHVYRLERAGYTCVLTAAAGEIVRASPFDGVDLRTDVWFHGEDDDE
jgi:Uma2 family endonuclease